MSTRTLLLYHLVAFTLLLAGLMLNISVEWSDAPIRWDTRALRFIREYNCKQAHFFCCKGRYASLSDLPLGGREIRPNLVEHLGFRFKISINDHGYWLQAWPIQRGKTGSLSWYSDQSQAIRLETGGRRATHLSPRVNIESEPCRP